MRKINGKQENSARPLLQIQEVVREYILPRNKLFASPKRLRALSGVSLSVSSGESFGLVGESGCGKSTLARTVMALESPQAGKIYFRGQNLHSLKGRTLRHLRRGLQMIFQDPYGSLDPRHSVERIIAEPLSLLGKITPEKQREQVAEALENVGLSPSDTNKYPHEFSGGQRQRIAIARALITRPALIVADEPVSALDVSVQAQVLNLMLDLREQYNLAYLFISHDLSIVRYMTTKVAVMYAGKIVEQGPTESLFDNARHPYTRALLAAIPHPDPSRRHRKQNKTSQNPNLPIFESTTETGCVYAPRCPLVTEKCRKNAPSLQAGTSAADYPQTTQSIQKDKTEIFDKTLSATFHQTACHYPHN